MNADDGPRASMAGLLGVGPCVLRTRLGDPRADREMDGQRWMVFELDGVGTLRCRCSPAVSTWSLSFAPVLPASLWDAARAVGLWPQLRPDAPLPDAGETLVRRALRGAREAGDGVASATALLRPEGVVRLAAFDETPEW